jgi:hypothetical protein
MPNIQPNRFVLHSTDAKNKVDVDYETSSFIGQPILNLTLGPGGPIRHFSGSQIRRCDTEIGTLVTVTTQMSIDTGSTSFSILIPAITLTAASDQKAFTTDAVITAHTGPNSVPSTGVHETYQFIPMKGQANFVLSLLQPVAGTATQAGNA